MAKNNPMFERRHYETIAEILAEATSCGEPLAIAISRDFADRLERDNPRFDRARFLKACGVES